MNKPADKDNDADARRVAAFRERQRAAIEKVKQSLAAWIEREDGAAWIEKENAGNFGANYTEVSCAMLETAFDRYIDLHGATDAFELIESAFRRRADKFRKSLQ